MCSNWSLFIQPKRLAVVTTRVFVSVLIALVAVSFLTTAAWADSVMLTASQTQQIGWMEEALLGSIRENESPTIRLETLEINIFGQLSPQKSVEQRLSSLDTALRARKNQAQQDGATTQPVAPQSSSSSPLSPPLKTTPAYDVVKKDTFNALDTAYGNGATVKNYSLRTPSSSGQEVESISNNTAVVDQLEQQVFQRLYSAEPMESRLTRLEVSVLGYPQSGHLAARTDNLRWLVLGNTPQQPDELTQANASPAYQALPQTRPPAQPNLPNPAVYQPAMGLPAMPNQGLPVYQASSSSASTATQADMEKALATIEKQELRTTYPLEPMNVRIDRLEHSIFHQSASQSGLSEEERLERIIAVSAAEQDGSASRSSGATSIKSMWPLIPMIILMLL